MQTKLDKQFLQSEKGKLVDKILRNCVHCGFCTATCPTYQVLGDELDGPRGRIYQIKQMLEGNDVTSETLKHLDRCLTCRACETTCPSGVEYAHLLEIGKNEVEKRVKRSLSQRLLRKILLSVLPYPERFNTLLKIGRIFLPILPAILKNKIPAKVTLPTLQLGSHNKKMLILDGCVQPALSPDINHATRKVLDALDIELISFSGCCGAINQHLSNEDTALTTMKNNIDRIITELDNGVEGIVITATGCGAMFKEYPYLLKDNEAYKEKAERVANNTFDLTDVIDVDKLKPLLTVSNINLAVHTPCTLQHAQKKPGNIEKLLTGCGYQLTTVKDKHLCCGSAGTYSITQPRLSKLLRTQRLEGLLSGSPDIIVTANIGCLHHLDEGCEIPVHHWIQIIETDLTIP